MNTNLDEFQNQFLDYLKTGTFPNGHSSVESLYTYIKTQLTLEQRINIRSMCYLEFEPKDEWHFKAPVINNLSSSLTQGALVSATAGAASYAIWRNPYASLGSAVSGVLWAFQSCHKHYQAEKRKYENYLVRFNHYRDILPIQAESQDNSEASSDFIQRLTNHPSGLSLAQRMKNK